MAQLAHEDREFLSRLRAEVVMPAPQSLSIYERLLDPQRAARIDEAEAAARQRDYDPVAEVLRIEARKHGSVAQMEADHRARQREVSRLRAEARRRQRFMEA